MDGLKFLFEKKVHYPPRLGAHEAENSAPKGGNQDTSFAAIQSILPYRNMYIYLDLRGTRNVSGKEPRI